MKKEDLKNLMEDTLETSKKLLLRDGYISPVAFMHHEDTMDIIGLTFKDEKEKEKQIYILGKLAKMKKADAIYILVESWYVTSDKKDFGVQPSKHSMRKECIFIYGECEEGKVTIMQKFERKEIKGGEKEEKEEIIFGEKDDIYDIGFSRFNFGIKK